MTCAMLADTDAGALILFVTKELARAVLEPLP